MDPPKVRLYTQKDTPEIVGLFREDFGREKWDTKLELKLIQRMGSPVKNFIYPEWGKLEQDIFFVASDPLEILSGVQAVALIPPFQGYFASGEFNPRNISVSLGTPIVSQILDEPERRQIQEQLLATILQESRRGRYAEVCRLYTNDDPPEVRAFLVSHGFQLSTEGQRLVYPIAA